MFFLRSKKRNNNLTISVVKQSNNGSGFATLD